MGFVRRACLLLCPPPQPPPPPLLLTMSASVQKMAKTLEDAAALSINAGMDQALGGDAFEGNLAGAVSQGKVTRAVLERAAASTLREKLAGHLFDKKFDG